MTDKAAKAAVVVADGYLDLEFWYPVLRLREAGAVVEVLGASSGETVRSTLGYPVIPDRSFSEAEGAYDVVVVPGGPAGERLSADGGAVRLVSSAAAQGAKILTVGSGRGLAARAQVAADAECQDADGLPGLLAGLLEER